MREPSNQSEGGSARLRGQVAIVTGAGRGVGRAVAERLAADGAAVALVARTASELAAVAEGIGELGGTAESLPADVTDWDAVTRAVEEIEARLGRPSLLVNNAGAWAQVGPLAEADVEAWWHDVEVSLKGTFLCTRAVLPRMLEGEFRFGRIVNVCSYAAINPKPFSTAYGSAKAAVVRLTDSLAEELADSGVRVFAVSPGFVRTRLVEDAVRSEAGRRYLRELEGRSDALEPDRLGLLVSRIATGELDPLAGRLLHVLDDLGAMLACIDEVRAEDLYTLRLRTLSPKDVP